MNANPGGGRDGKIPFETEETIYPATVGWHWFNEDGAEYSITWERWTSRMTFGIRIAGRDDWSKTDMAPRWANHSKTLEGARAVVKHYLEKKEA
ncbi:MAG TPA: hypothetical protein VK735_18485 [Pseudonocardia sp.]|uniref:hypothetical protein n=1 Tax=Pseudonocardia sp. TaxID=60912 RepID=UPI002C73766E|nr:hypothetical protein [Pseudonocardia sp.]HTF49434.1 hypothetical protein [Pseudonocardia sp.]